MPFHKHLESFASLRDGHLVSPPAVAA